MNYKSSPQLFSAFLLQAGGAKEKLTKENADSKGYAPLTPPSFWKKRGKNFSCGLTVTCEHPTTWKFNKKSSHVKKFLREGVRGRAAFFKKHSSPHKFPLILFRKVCQRTLNLGFLLFTVLLQKIIIPDSNVFGKGCGGNPFFKKVSPAYITHLT